MFNLESGSGDEANERKPAHSEDAAKKDEMEAQLDAECADSIIYPVVSRGEVAAIQADRAEEFSATGLDMLRAVSTGQDWMDLWTCPAAGLMIAPAASEQHVSASDLPNPWADDDDDMTDDTQADVWLMPRETPVADAIRAFVDDGIDDDEDLLVVIEQVEAFALAQATEGDDDPIGSYIAQLRDVARTLNIAIAVVVDGNAEGFAIDDADSAERGSFIDVSARFGLSRLWSIHPRGLTWVTLQMYQPAGWEDAEQLNLRIEFKLSDCFSLLRPLFAGKLASVRQRN